MIRQPKRLLGPGRTSGSGNVVHRCPGWVDHGTSGHASIALIRVGCEFVQVTTAPTPVVMQMSGRPWSTVSISDESWSVDPDVETHTYTDLYDNRCLRLVLPEGESRFRYEARVDAPGAAEPVDGKRRNCRRTNYPMTCFCTPCRADTAYQRCSASNPTSGSPTPRPATRGYRRSAIT